ncbi:MAG: amino acid--tRNA ligase-related protein [Candidatus Taylorbacteria bacterium]
MQKRIISHNKNLGKRLTMQSDLLFSIHHLFHKKGFKEINTPILSFPTKEYGDGEFVVVSKLQPGKFYSLPHSPQLYKQYLLARFPELKAYYQIASNFRPEIGDNTHAQEFHQIDFEIANLSLDDVRRTIEQICSKAFSLIDIRPTYTVMRFEDSVCLYGSDSPDLRYSGGEFRNDGKEVYFEIPIRDVLDLQKLKSQLRARTGVSMRIGPKSFVFASQKGNLYILGDFRNRLIKNYVLRLHSKWSFVWLIDLPLFKRDGNGQISTFHHPQMSPMSHYAFWKAAKSKDINEVLSLRGNGCELIVNGMELGGGNVRNNDLKIQKEILNICGVSDTSLRSTFKPLLDMLRSHPNYKSSGAAVGLDRLMMLLTKSDSLSDNRAFPQDNNGTEYFGGPSNVSMSDLQELGLDYEHPIITQSRQTAIRLVEANNNFIHDRKHIQNVEQNAVAIAINEGVLPDEILILRLAAHWHDVGRNDWLPREIEPHAEISMKAFREWANTMGMPNSVITPVELLIKEHDELSKIEHPDKLLKILQDGDRLDVINVERVQRILA